MKIGIVGSGLVGSTAAYAIIMSGIGREIVLVDRNQARAQAEADDLYHAVPFASPMEIVAGDYDALAGCSVVIMAAGVNQKPDETRLQLLERNAAVFREVIPQIVMHAPDAILVVATNPVDVMTHLTASIAAQHGLAAGRVLGSGTTLDSARFRALLGRQLGIDSRHIHAYVVGEHGDSEVLTWSLVAVGNIPLEQFSLMKSISLTDEVRASIDERVRRAAYHIIQGKGATYYGIGSALARIVDVILHDQRAVLTVCSPMDDIAGVKDVTVSVPHLLGGEGVLDAFPMPLSEDEEAALHRSASIVREAIGSLGL